VKVVILALALLAACRKETPPPPPPPLVPQDWGGLKFTEVRAFRMNWDDQSSLDRIRAKDGTLNKTRLPKQGIALNASQIDRLHKAVTTEDSDFDAGCGLMPHHAFLFYDAGGAIAGALNVCFICGIAIGEPEAFVTGTNFTIFRELIEDLGLPEENPKWRR
jgi:hypothetical protein